MRIDKLLAEQIIELIDKQTHKLLGAVQDGRVVLGGSAGSYGGTGDPPAGFWGQLRQGNVAFDTAGSRPCSSGSAGSDSLVDNLDRIRLGWEICDDAINEDHIDWGHGAGQVSAVDVPFASTSGSISSTNVRDAIEEAYAAGGGGGGGSLDDAYNLGRQITADAGAVEILDAGGLLSEGNVVLDDGSGDSPELRFVGGSNDDVARFYLDDDAVSGRSDMLLLLPGTSNQSAFYIKTSAGATRYAFYADGTMLIPSGGGISVADGYLQILREAEIAGQFWSRTALTNTVGEVVRLKHTGGAVAAGFGGRLLYELEDGAGGTKNAGAIDVVWSDPGSGTEDAFMSFRLMSGGSAHAEIARFQGDGLLMAAGKEVSIQAGHIKMTERVGDPPNAANTCFLYPKDDGAGNTELYFEDESGNVEKLTPVQVSTYSHIAAESDAAQVIPNNAITLHIYEDEHYDALGEYDHTTGVFTATVGGYYHVHASLLYNWTVAWGGAERAELWLYLDGAQYCSLCRLDDQTATQHYAWLNGGITLRVEAGETIDIRTLQNTGGNLPVLGAAMFNQLSIDRLP